jgi:hypothetical protein
MARKLVLNFLGGIAIAAVFLEIAMAANGAAAAADRPGCRVVIGAAVKDGANAPVFETDHSRCRLVA